MKISIAHILVVLLISVSFSTPIVAQPINIGSGMVVTTERPNLGFKAQVTYGVDSLLKNLKGSFSSTLFFPSTTNEIKYNRVDFDLDGQYTFYQISGFKFYLIGGLNFSYFNTKWIDSGGKKVSEVRPGLNFGSGVNVEIGNKTKAFSEFKYVFNLFDQANICFGVLIEL